ncbi:DUF6655 family protein [Thalassobaculum sp.]|uniref:DUF6655 family protein n=1 Tax=Thalassobaculum sp. TaxID=2022740 RepID=UPI0032EE30BA
MIRPIVQWIALAVLVAAMVPGCTKTKESSPKRTATEQILLSTAVDRAARELVVNLPPGTKVFLDASRFEAYDRGYAISAIRDRFLASGAHMAESREKADVIAELRAGALSTNESESIVGIPSYSIPIPLAGDLELPELALMKQTTRRGLAKFGFTAHWTENGALAARTDPVIGISGFDNWKLLGLGWHEGDTIPSKVPNAANRERRAPEKNGSAEADP